MKKIYLLRQTFTDAKQEADAYFKNCKDFCNRLAATIMKDFGCEEDCKHAIETKRIERQQILTMMFHVPPYDIPVRFVVTKRDKEFIVKIDNTTDEYAIPDMAAVTEQHSHILDATYKRLEKLTVAAAWQAE